MQTFHLFSPLRFAVVALALVVPAMAQADDTSLAPQDANVQLGAHFFVGRWSCQGETRVPGLPSMTTTAQLQAEDHGSWTLDHFDAKGALGLGAHAKGWSTWDPDTKTLHRYASPYFGPPVHWVNQGGWDGDTLMLEAHSKALFGLANVYVLDVFTKADDNRSFHHATYYAKDSKTWEAFYIADCVKTGGKTLH